MQYSKSEVLKGVSLFDICVNKNLTKLKQNTNNSWGNILYNLKKLPDSVYNMNPVHHVKGEQVLWKMQIKTMV